MDKHTRSSAHSQKTIATLEHVLVDKDQVIQERDDIIQSKDRVIQGLEKEIKFLEEQIRLMRCDRFGKKSETSNSLQIEIPFEPHEEAVDDQPKEEKETITYERKKAKVGRKIDTSNLPREQVIHDLPDEEKICSCCQSDLVLIGQDSSEKIEYVPAVLKVVEHIQPKYACRQCDTVISAKKPDEVLPKCMAGVSLLTEVILGKYQNHCPLYRQSKILGYSNIDIPANTLGNWVMGVGEALAPLEAALYQQLSDINVLQADETPVKNADLDKKSYMWCYHSLKPDNRFVIFEYKDSRSASVPEKSLASFKGILQTDGYSGYKGLREREDIQGVGCMAHVRRKFADVIKIAGAQKTGKAHIALSEINKLYRIEHKARQDKLSHEQRHLLRQTESVPILNQFRKWLEESIRTAPSGGALGKALSYALNQWSYLKAYTDYGEIEIDNNLVENLIRPFALGRRNWLFLGNERGAKVASTLYTLIQTCHINKINTYDYFQFVLTQLGAVRRGEIEAKSLLPQFIDKSLLRKK